MPFTEFIPPYGRRELVAFPVVDEDTQEHARKLLNVYPNARFECEILSTKDGSFTFTDQELGDLAIVIIFNKDRLQAKEKVSEWIKSLTVEALDKMKADLTKAEQEE